MEHLKFETPDMVAGNIEKIGALFPSAITEMRGEDGQIKKGINFEVLKQLLSRDVVDGDECYEFTWVGKKAAMAEAARPITKTLRPVKEDSRDWDTTQNLYIEGDNLEVLKILQESYLGKVKMIYIDPPYNTGHDFIYRDKFQRSQQEENELMGMYDEDENQMFENTESNGRFHSDWCSYIYRPLVLARNLLSEDGVIFIQIDDNEVETLGKVLNDVFSEENFVNIVTVKTKIGGVSGSSEGKSLKDATEFIWIYAKNKAALSLNPVYLKTKLFDRIKEYEREKKSWKYTSIITKLSGKALIKEDTARGYRYYGYAELETMSISAFARSRGITEEDVYNQYADRIYQTTNAQSSVRMTVIKETQGLDFPMIGCEYTPIKGKNEGNTIEILYKGDQRRMMMFLSDAVEKVDGTYYYLDKITSLWDDIDYNNLTKEGNVEFSNGKKPIKLLQRMVSLSTSENSLVLDFFSGSSSTAHAVMQLNAEDGGKRRFIMVQLPEDLDESLDRACDTNTKESIRASIKFLDSINKKHTICEIGKERIRRAGDKIKADNPLGTQGLDTGFRVFRVDSSNMKDVYYHPEELDQQSLGEIISNIKDDRTDMDLLYACLLDWGVEIHLPHTSTDLDSCTVHNVDNGALMACFNTNVPTSVVEYMAKQQPLRAVFRDSAFASDDAKINVTEIFKNLSPDTKVKVI